MLKRLIRKTLTHRRLMLLEEVARRIAGQPAAQFAKANYRRGEVGGRPLALWMSAQGSFASFPYDKTPYDPDIKFHISPLINRALIVKGPEGPSWSAWLVKPGGRKGRCIWRMP